MTDISFKGDQELLNALGEMAHTDVYKEVIEKSRSNLQEMAQRKTVSTKDYSTGATKHPIKLELETSGLEARVKATTNYSGCLEVGTRKTEAQPFIQPAFSEVQPKFTKDLRKAEIAK